MRRKEMAVGEVSGHGYSPRVVVGGGGNSHVC